MAFAPIALTIPQYENYANNYLKAYNQGTTTPLSIATDAAGGTLLVKVQLDAQGFPITAGSARFVPFINGDYDLWLFPTAAEADANDTTNAIQFADNLNADPTSTIVALSTIPSVASKAAAELLTLTDGLKIFIDSTDGGLFTMKTGAAIGTYNDNGGNFTGTRFTSGDGSSGFLRDFKGGLNPIWFGAPTDGVADSYVGVNLCQIAAVVEKTEIDITEGIYLFNTLLDFTQHINFAMGAILKPANGIKIRFKSSFKASVTQHFDTSLSGLIEKADGGQLEVYPEYWGCVGDGANDATTAAANTVPMQSCLNYSLGSLSVLFRSMFTVDDVLTFNTATKLVSQNARSLGGIDFRVTKTVTTTLFGPDTANSQSVNLCVFENIKLNINVNSTVTGAGEIVLLYMHGGKFAVLQNCTFDSQMVVPSSVTLYTVRYEANAAISQYSFNQTIKNNWFNGKFDVSLHLKGAVTTSNHRCVGFTIENNEFLNSTLKTTGFESDIWVQYSDSIFIGANRLANTGNTGSGEPVNIRVDNSSFLNIIMNYYEQGTNGNERIVLGVVTSRTVIIESHINNQEITDTGDDGYMYFGNQAKFTQQLTAGASNREVISLRQKHASEPFMQFRAISKAADANAPLVDAADLTTPGSIVGWVAVEIQDDKSSGSIADGTYYIPFYSAPT